ncbi:MAG: ABC transporter ATP-binding protein [Burkholderiaceae bacterium]|nr:MAG: ABC transporter ATP-binding protein [Burkholderiaceae bacterium]
MATIIEAVGLNKSFGAVTAASDISVAIPEGDVVGLIGTNGAGKTTFVNMVTGYLKPDTGSIAYNGADITRLSPREITRLGICRSFQIPQLYDTLTARENLAIGLGIVSRNAKKSMFSRLPKVMPGYDRNLWDTADLLLDQFGLAPYRDRVAGALPEGVRKLLDITLALVSKPRVILLDEPTSGVSTDEKFAIMDRVMDVIRGAGVTVLFVEHDMDIVSRYASRVLAFYDGRVLADGAVEAVLADADVRRLVVGSGHGTGSTAAQPGARQTAVDAN